MTVSEALARGIDLSALPVGLNERFETEVHWRQQARSSRVTVTAQLNERIRVRQRLPKDAGSGQGCGTWVAGSVHVTLNSDDASIEGGFDARTPYWLARPAYDRRLTLLEDWSPTIQLHGNLELKPDLSRTPSKLQLQFLWYRIDEIPADRIGIGIVLYYQEPKLSGCSGGGCLFEYLATAVPPDDCLPWQLPSDGSCVDLQNHPLYGAPPSVPEAGVPEAGLPTSVPEASVPASSLDGGR